MIIVLPNTPSNIVAFKALGEVTKKDFEEVVMPAVDNLVKKTGKLNYLLEIDTELSNFTAGAWWQDALLGIKKLTKWNKAAIISDSEGISKFTTIFSVIMPGEFKAFKKTELNKAIEWVSAE
jgi:hypothetical protein